MQSLQTGQLAESLACRFLTARGLRLLKRNFRRRIGEIDLVMEQTTTGTWVFVEVRFRTSSTFGGATASVDRRKQRKLVATALAYLQQHGDALQRARIDVLAIQPASSCQLPTAGSSSVRFTDFQFDWTINAIEADN